MPHFAILGAGITGVTTAYQLHAKGFDVTVIDRNRYSAMETSFANGGQLSASNAEVWNSWGTIFKGLKWLMQRDAPLLVRPTPTWHKISWMAEFMANIGSYKANTTQTAKLAITARQILHEMAAHADVDFDFSPAGIMHFYSNDADMKHARKVTDLLAKGGLQREELTPEQVNERVPELAGSFVGGYWTESDATGDIHKYTTGLASWLERQGVTFDMGQSVKSARAEDGQVHIETDAKSHTYDGVVVCAGVGSRAIAAQLGDRVNIYPVKGYSITVQLNDAASQAAAPQVSLLDDKAKIVTSRLGPDRFRVAGTAEFAGNNRDICASRISPLVDWVEQYFPGVSTEHVTPWAGLRPMMPNMLPKVGPGRAQGVYYNTGHGHLGWTLSAATAALVAEHIVAGTDAPAKPVGPLGQTQISA